MDQKTTYEITIAGKLEQISIPDMSEMIWARIERELDADPGDGEDGGDGPSSPVAPSPAKGIILGVTSIVFLIAFLVNYSSNQIRPVIAPLELPKQTTPANATNSPPASNSNELRGVTPTVRQSPVSTNNTAHPPVLVVDTVSARPDSLNQSLVVPRVGSDSTDFTDAADLANQPPPTKDSIAPKKRGVKGISQGDYRIVPKKDTGR